MFDAQYDIYQIYNRNRDAHTGWSMNQAFYYVFFSHPIALGSYLDGNGDQKFRVEYSSTTQGMFTEYNNVYSTTIDFASLEGYEVISINGQTPEEHLKSICTSYGMTRDNGTCLNELLRTSFDVYGTYSIRFLIKMTIPESTVSYVFKNPETNATMNIDIDFLSCILKSGGGCYDITDTDALKQLLGVSSSSSSSSSSTTAEGNDEKNDLQQQQPFRKLTIDEIKSLEGKRRIQEIIETSENNNRRGGADSVTVDCYNIGQQFLMYHFDDYPDVEVIMLADFSPSDSYYVSGVCSCMGQISSTSQIVVDLRSNGGGSIFWGMDFTRAFSKKTLPEFTEMYGPFLVSKQFVFPESWKPSFHILDGPDARFVEMDGSVSTFHPYVRYNLSSDSFIYGDLKECSGFTGIEPEDILIVTDGSCGSTCGMFTKSMKAMEAGKVLTFGGWKGENIDPTSFDGASVTDVNGGGSFRYSWAGAFNFDHDAMYDRSKYDVTKLMGYSYTPSDFRVYNWTGLTKDTEDLIYLAIEETLPKCASWNIKIDETCPSGIEHGIYGRPCINEAFDMTANCVLKRCEDGFYMNPNRDQCIPIEQAPMWDIFDELYCGVNTGLSLSIFTILLIILCFLS